MFYVPRAVEQVNVNVREMRVYMGVRIQCMRGAGSPDHREERDTVK